MSSSDEEDIKNSNLMFPLDSDVKDDIDELHESNIDRSKSFFDKLGSNADACIDWQLPDLHKFTAQLIRLPDKNTVQKIQESELEFKQGYFTEEENRILRRNWKELCRTFDLPDTPHEFASWRKKGQSKSYIKLRRFVILWLSKGLPNRLPSQVYHNFLHTMGSKVKGRFSKQELSIVESCMNSSDRKHTHQFLASVLGRDEKSVWRCVNLLKANKSNADGPSEEKRKIRWTLKLNQRLLEAIVSTIYKNQDPLTNETVEKLRLCKPAWKHWTEIGKKINLPPLACKRHWDYKLYTQLFVTEKLYFKHMIRKIIKIFIRNDVKSWKEINWQIVISHFDGISSLFISKKFYDAVIKYCKHKVNDFPDVLRCLWKLFVENNGNIQNFRLKRLRISKHHCLEYVVEEKHPR